MGFIAADGSFSNCNRLKLVLSIADEEHLKLFANYINAKLTYYTDKNGYKSVGVSCMQVDLIPQLMKKFDLKTRKTYNPPSSLINISNDNLFISFLVGFIDGDGYLAKRVGRPDCHLKIKNHSSWLNILKEMRFRVENLTGIKLTEPTLNKQGYAEFRICNSRVLRYLKSKTVKLKLPCLRRKWGEIDDKFVSRYEVIEEHGKQIKEMLQLGIRQTVIAKKLNINRATVAYAIQKYNLNGRIGRNL
jgi:hypothetical protein